MKELHSLLFIINTQLTADLTVFTAQDRGSEGSIPVSDLKWTTPLGNAFLKAGKMLGFKVRDLNGAQQTGIHAVLQLYVPALWTPLVLPSVWEMSVIRVTDCFQR